MRHSLFSAKTGFLFLIVLSLVMVTGCQQFGIGQGPASPTGGETFIGGSEGLDFAFAEDQPPLQILDSGEEEFFITLLLKNEGEHTIPVGGVIGSLSGIVQTSFSIGSMNKKSDIEIFSVSREGGVVIPGGEEFLEFGSASFKATLPGNTPFTLRADVCYDYQTLAVSKVCLKQEVLKKEVGQVCDTNNPKVVVENSGSPVHVKDVRQSTVGGSKIRVSFQIANVGQGQVYRPDTFAASCTGMQSEKEKVDVKLISPDNNFNVECSQLGNSDAGTVKLVNNKKDISCTIDTSGLSEVTVQDILIIELNYQYREAVATSLTVVSSQ